MMHRLRLAILTTLISTFAVTAAQADGLVKFNTERFLPALGPENVITVEGTRTPGQWMPMASLIMDWSYLPLTLLKVDVVTNQQTGTVAETIRHNLVFHAMAGIGLTKWWSIGIDLPIFAYQDFDRNTPLADVPEFTSGGVGDLRLMTKFRILNNQDGGFGLAFVPQIIFPTGNSDQFRGDGSVNFDIRFAFDYKFKKGAFVAFNLSFLGRTSDAFLSTTLNSHEIRYALGGYLPFGSSSWGGLLELTGGTSIFNGQYIFSSMDIHAGVRWNHKSGFMALGGVGTTLPLAGSAAAAGSPAFRLFVGIGFEKIKEEKKPVPVKLVPPPTPTPEEPDTDGDGLIDKLDKCPTVPGPIENEGCPLTPEEPDTDKDGIVDRLDKCPYEPGPKETDGCPPPRKYVQVTQNNIKLLQKIQFATNKWNIKPASFPLLDEVVDVIKSRPTMRVHIEGHTDKRGLLKWNLQLSRNRAASVLKYLVDHGISADRLTSEGYGPLRPALTPEQQRGMTKVQIQDADRRTEFTIVQQ